MPSELNFGFCKSLEKITNGIGFHLNSQTGDLQELICTTIGVDINITINSFYLYVRILIPDQETQGMFHESFKNSFTLTFDFWTTDRKKVDTGREYQLDVGSSLDINSPKFSIEHLEDIKHKPDQDPPTTQTILQIFISLM